MQIRLLGLFDVLKKQRDWEGEIPLYETFQEEEQLPTIVEAVMDAMLAIEQENYAGKSEKEKAVIRNEMLERLREIAGPRAWPVWQRKLIKAAQGVPDGE